MPATAKSAPRTARATMRDSVRSSILDAASDVFVRSGFHRTRMTAIARAAGVAVGTLYNYFDSKEAIFDQIMATRGAAFRSEIAPVLRAGTPSEQLANLVRSLLAHIDQDGALCAIF